MSTKSFFLFALAASAMLLNLSGCKDDEDDFEYTFENCVEDVIFKNINNGDTIREAAIRPDYYINILRKDGVVDIYTGAVTRIGTSKNDMKRVLENSEYNIQPFSAYYIEYTPYVEHEGDTIYGAKKELMFYSMPDEVELELSTDNGDDENAAKIKWSVFYYYYTGGGKRELSSELLDGCTATITITPQIDTTYNKTPIEVSAKDGSCYIKAGNDYPSYKNVYLKGSDIVYYWDAIKYSFKVLLERRLDDGKTIIIGSSEVTDIFIDKSKCIKDKYLNIYRYQKFGNQYWTIDDLRTRAYQTSQDERTGKNPSGMRGSAQNREYILYYGYEVDKINVLKGLSSCESEGFRVPTEADWLKLEKYFGVEPQDVNTYKYTKMIENLIDSVNNKSIDMSSHFVGAGTRLRFDMMSQYGWVDNDGNKMIGNGLFNSFPNGSIGWNHWAGVDTVAVYFVEKSNDHRSTFRLLSNKYDGIMRLISPVGNCCGSIRLVKDVE